MKVVILAGGFGTRISEYTDDIPKPLITVNGKPILVHIMEYYASYGYKEFIIALGYKGEAIKNYFLNYSSLQSDLEIDKSGKIKILSNKKLDWEIKLIDTGLNTFTGGRIKRLEKYLDKERFFLTYGDGLSNVNLDKLLNFHKRKKKLITVTAVRPTARFGELEINHNNDLVKSFKEKPQMHQGWINGGFFVIEPDFLKFIKNDKSILERDPMTIAANKKELSAFKHRGFWQCMDSKRDKETLEKLSKMKKLPWKKI